MHFLLTNSFLVLLLLQQAQGLLISRTNQKVSFNGFNFHQTKSIASRLQSTDSDNNNANTGKSSPKSSTSKSAFDTLLEKELSQFQQQSSSSPSSSLNNNSVSPFDRNNLSSKLESSSSKESSSSPLAGVKNIISSLLVADFFLVIFFLGWYLLAVVTQSSTPVVLERFQDIFQPVIVPSLTVLMVGSIASGVLGNDDKKINN